MRYYIYISFLVVLSIFCFSNAMGQARTRFGGQGGATDSAFTMNQLLLKAYATSTPNMFLKMTSTGHVVLAVPAGGGTGFVDSVTISNDSLFYWGSGVSFFVGIVNSGGSSIDTTGLSDRINYNLTRIDGQSDTISLHSDTLEAHKDWLNSIESEIAGIPIVDSTLFIRYSDTPYIPTQTYLEANYFKNGGNVFGDEFKIGNNTWSQYIYGDGNGDYIFNNGAGPGWMFHWVQNNLDTVLTINRQNEILVGSVGNAPIDAGYYKFQVQGSGYIRDSLTVGGMPKLSAAPDTSVGIVNGLLVSYATPDGGDTIGLQGVLENGNTADLPIKLVDYVNPNAQIEARAKLGDLVLKREQDFADTASGVSLLVNPKYNIGAISPSFQINGAEISPMYKLDGSTNVRGWSLQLNRYYDSSSSGHILNHTMLSTGGNFGVNERLERYCGVEIHTPPVYDTADYIYGLRVNSFTAPNLLNSAAIAIGPISDVYTGNWNIYCSQYVTKPNHLGNVPTYIGLPDDTPIDDTSKLQFTTGISSGLMRYKSDLSATYDDRTMVDKGYVDAEIAAIPVIDTTSLDARINAKQPYTQTTVIDEQTNTTYSASSINLKRTGSGSTITSTAGNSRIYHAVGTFAPTSGTGAFASIASSPIINQTGGANGITSGFLANPLLTAAADYRAFDAANNSGVAFYNRWATARNVFVGETRIGGENDLGDYLLQVSGAAIFDDSIRASGLPRGTQDSCVYIGTNGTFYKGLCPAGGIIDSIRISNDSLYQCAGGTCTYVGMVNTGGGGSGTVTSVTATDGNGFDFTVANTTTTPVISATLQSNYNFVTDAQLTVIGNTSGTNTGDQTSVTGNAGTATALQTGRTIDNVTFDGTANIKLNRVWQGKLAGETDTLTTGVKLTFRMPYACTITGVKAAVNTASSSGNITIDIHENGTTIMATNKITIEATETTSLDATTQPTVSDTSIAADALMTIEVDAAGTNAISGEVTIFYTLQ